MSDDDPVYEVDYDDDMSFDNRKPPPTSYERNFDHGPVHNNINNNNNRKPPPPSMLIEEPTMKEPSVYEPSPATESNKNASSSSSMQPSHSDVKPSSTPIQFVPSAAHIRRKSRGPRAPYKSETVAAAASRTDLKSPPTSSEMSSTTQSARHVVASSLKSPPQSANVSSLKSPPQSASVSSLKSPPQSASVSSLKSPPQSASVSSLKSLPESASASSLKSLPESASASSLKSPPEPASVSSLKSPPESANVSSLKSPPESANVSSLKSPPESANVSSLKSPPQSANMSSLKSPPESSNVSSLKSPPDVVTEAAATTTVVREAKWTGEAEEEATLRRRKVIKSIMMDTSLTSAERSRKIQDLMSGKIALPEEKEDPTSQEPTPPVKEAKWTGEVEEGTTVAKRKAIQGIMKDTTLSNDERRRKIQELMSGGRTSPIPPITSEAVKPGFSAIVGSDQRITRKMSRGVAPLSGMATTSGRELSNEDTGSDGTMKPGFSSVKGVDPRIRRKASREVSPMTNMNKVIDPMMEPNKNDILKPGVTAVHGDDARISRKMSRTMTPISARTSQTSDVGTLQEPDREDIKPGFTVVRGADPRISGKVSRGTTAVTALPSDFNARPQYDNDEAIRPDDSGPRRATSRISDHHRASRSSSPGIIGGSVGASIEEPNSPNSPVPGVTAVRGNDARVSRKVQSNNAVSVVASEKFAALEPTVSKPGAINAQADSKLARKMGVASIVNASNSATSFESYEVEPDEPHAFMPGSVASMTNVAQKKLSISRSPGAVAASDDSRVQRKIGSSRNSGGMITGVSISGVESFEDEPDGLPLPGTAVASSRDSRVARKIAQAQSGVGASAETDDSAVSKKAGRTRGAAAGIAAATTAATVGAVQTFGDDPAAQKKSFVQDELFATDEGKEINPHDYLMQQVRATQEAQQKMVDKKKQEKDKNKANGTQKDGVAALPKTPGAFSVKGGRGWFTGGFRQRAARGMVRNRSRLVQDAEVIALDDDDVDEDETWWDRADKPTLIVGACILVFMIIAITVPLTLVKTAVPPPTPAPTSPRFFLSTDFQELFSQVSDPSTFENTQSPQSLALNWILYDDELQLGPTDNAAIQRYICMVIYFSNGGEQWDFPQPAVEWGSGVHECEWDYVTCMSNKTIGKLNLLEVGMTGTLETELASLSQLTSLDVGRNDLSEVQFPSLLFQMTQLMYLYLDVLKMKGTIPSEIAKLTKLEQLYLSSNSFTGTLPTEMRSLSLMQSFQVSMNLLEGDIFGIISSWPALENVDIGNNDFDGSLPPDLPQSLVSLRFDRNSIRGVLPMELGNLSNLKSLIATQNFRLGGALPSELGRCSSLEILHVDSNIFNGNLPTELGKLPAIKDIRLGQNEFTGMIPSEIGLCSTLESLDFNNNNFNNSVPLELGQLSKLTQLWLQFTDVSGTMPPEICSLRQLTLDDLQADCKFSTAQLKCDEPACCTSCQ